MFEEILFPVKKKPILYNGQETGRSMIIREDKDEFVSIVSDDYLLIPNRLVLDSVVREFSGIIDNKQKPQLFSTGAYSSVSFNLKYPTKEVKVGDNVGAVIRIENSYDTSKSLRVSMNAVRLVCSNGMTVDSPLFQSRVKHIGNIQPEDVVQEMIGSIGEKGEETFVGLNETFMQMAKTELTDDIKNKFIKTLSDYPNYVVEHIVKQITETNPVDLWDLYNCVTYVTTHNMDRNKFSTLKAEEDLNKEILQFIN
jgi:hypothetical protein